MTDAHSSRSEPESSSPEADGAPRTRLLAATSSGFGTIALGLLIIAPLLPAIIDDLGLSPFRAGIALSVMWGLNALSQYPGGRISDEIGRKTVLVFALIGFAVGFVVLTLSTTFVGFLVAIALVGICAGLYPPAGYVMLSELYTDRRGRAFGIYTACWDIGGGISAGFAAAAIALGEWRFAFPPIVVLAVIAALFVHRWRREPYDVGRVSFDFRGTVSRTFADREVSMLILAVCGFMIVWQGSVSFLPTYLQAEKGLSPSLAATAFASLFLIGMLVKPISGSLADRIGSLRAAGGALGVGVAGLVLIAVASGPVQVLGAVGVFAAGLMSFSPPMLSHVTATLPDRNVGGDFGGFRTVYMGVGSLGSTYVGFVAGIATYETAFLGLLVALFVSLSIIVVVGRR